MQGLMQNWPLTLDKILDHARDWHGDVEIVSRLADGQIARTTYRDMHSRAKKMSSALIELGMRPGDRIGTLAWNSARHMETWYAIMGVGAICHTLNPRLFAEDLCYIINNAEDKFIFSDAQFLPVLASIRSKLTSVKHIIVMADRAGMQDIDYPGALCFEDLLERSSAECRWGGFDENMASSLCYTSGTSGTPKGVLYSHRSNFLHTLVTINPDVFNLSAMDVVLPIVPMFHANAWGLAFSGPAVGATMVMPGAQLDGASVYELLETEGVTFSAAVPTVFQTLLEFLRETSQTLSTLKRVVIGGSAVPESIVRGFQDEYGVEVTHAWGMTEISPLGTLSAPTRRLSNAPAEVQLSYKLMQGRAPLGFEMKIVGDAGEILPNDGKTSGRLLVKGPYVAKRYFGGEADDVLDSDGFFDTGDIATIDESGFMRITDRAKDVIKSGGEWISSIALENIAIGHPKAALAAVIGVAHPKWDERPVLVVKLKDGENSDRDEFLSFLRDKVAKWWLPDDVVFVNNIPLGPTGKIDKKVLRSFMQNYRLPNLGDQNPDH